MRVKFFILTTLLFCISCTRNTGDKSSLTLQLPPSYKISNKISTLSVQTLEHVVINIRNSSGIVIQKFNWDSECEVEICPEAPGFFEFEVKKGQYLIQVLAIYEDESAESIEFNYGQTEKNLQNRIEDVVINISSISTGSGKEVRYGGRYLTSDNAGPTGTVTVSYQPPGNVPEIEIMDEVMFNGWFIAFGIEGAPFNYKIKSTGEYILQNADPTDSTDIRFNDQAYRMRVEIPNYYSQKDSQWELELGGEVLYGFYGAHVAANGSDYVVCYNDVNDDPYQNIYSDAGTTAMPFDSQAPYSSPSLHPLGTGGNKSGSCMSGSETYKLLLNHKYFDGWLGSFFGFEGPYASQQIEPERYSPINILSGTIVGDQANLTIDWDYLPSVKGTAVSSSTAFLIPSSAKSKYRSNGEYYRCNLMYANSQPFQNIHTLGEVTRFEPSFEDSNGGQTIISLPSQQLQSSNSSNYEVVLCPYTADHQYYRAGVSSHGLYFNFPTHTLDVKLVGTGSVAESSTYKYMKPLGTNDYSFLNANITGSFNKIHLIPVTFNQNENHFVSPTDIDLVEMTFDGTTWIDLTSNCSSDLKSHTDSMGNSMMRIEFYSLSSCSSVSSSWASASSDSTIKFRITVDPSKMQNYGLGGGLNNVFTTGNLVLKADTACSSHALTMVKTSAPTTIVANTNFMDEFFGSNGSDVETEYELAWESSAAVCVDTNNGNRNIKAIINNTNLLGMPNCFSDNDYFFSNSHPFSFTISPLDLYASNCNLNTASFNVNVAGENATTYSASFGASDIIQHSTTASHLNAYLSNDASATLLGDHSFSLDKVFVKTGLELSVLSAYTNSDHQAINRGSGAGIPGSVDWGIESAFVTAGNLSNKSSLTLAGAPHNKTVSFTGGGQTGQFELISHNLNEDVVWVDEKKYQQGSPLIVTIDGSSQIRIYYIPRESNDLKLLVGPVTGGSTTTRATHYHNGGSYTYILYNTYQELNYVAINYDEQIQSTDSVNLNSKKLWDFKVLNDSSNDFVLAVTEDGFNDGKIFYLPFSSYNGSSWTHPSSPSTKITNEAGRIMDCAGQMYLNGIWNANYGALIPFSISPNTINYTGTNHSLAGNGTNYYYGEYTHFGCADNTYGGDRHFFGYRAHNTAQMPSAGRLPLIFKGYNEGSQTSYTQALINDSSTHIDYMGYYDIAGTEKLMVITRSTTTSNPVLVKLYTPQSSGTAYTFDKTIASFPNNSTEYLNGIQKVQDGPEGERFYIYGNSGQIYIVKMR